MAVTLTAYAIAQGYTLSLLASGFYFTTGVSASVYGVSRLVGAGFVAVGADPALPGQNAIFKFATRTPGQLASAATKVIVPGSAYVGPNFIICCNNDLYTGGTQSGTLGTLWKSADETNFSIIQTYGTAVAAQFAGMSSDPVAGTIYSSAVTNATIFKADTTTFARTTLTSDPGKTGQSLSLSSNRTSVYFARRTDIAIVRVSDGVITRTISANTSTTSRQFYDVMPLTGNKGGKILGITITGPDGNVIYEINLADESLQALTSDLGLSGRLHLFENNQVAFGSLDALYLLTTPTGAGVSKGTCYDSTLGGDDAGNGTGGGTIPTGDGGDGGPNQGGSGCDCCSFTTPTAPSCTISTRAAATGTWRARPCQC